MYSNVVSIITCCSREKVCLHFSSLWLQRTSECYCVCVTDERPQRWLYRKQNKDGSSRGNCSVIIHPEPPPVSTPSTLLSHHSWHSHNMANQSSTKRLERNHFSTPYLRLSLSDFCSGSYASLLLTFNWLKWIVFNTHLHTEINVYPVWKLNKSTLTSRLRNLFS